MWRHESQGALQIILLRACMSFRLECVCCPQHFAMSKLHALQHGPSCALFRPLPVKGLVDTAEHLALHSCKLVHQKGSKLSDPHFSSIQAFTRRNDMSNVPLKSSKRKFEQTGVQKRPHCCWKKLGSARYDVFARFLGRSAPLPWKQPSEFASSLTGFWQLWARRWTFHKYPRHCCHTRLETKMATWMLAYACQCTGSLVCALCPIVPLYEMTPSLSMKWPLISLYNVCRTLISEPFLINIWILYEMRI